MMEKVWRSRRLKTIASVGLFADATLGVLMMIYKYSMALWWFTGSGNIALFSDFWYEAVQYHAPKLIAANLYFIVPMMLLIIVEYYVSYRLWRSKVKEKSGDGH